MHSVAYITSKNTVQKAAKAVAIYFNSFFYFFW